MQAAQALLAEGLNIQFVVAGEPDAGNPASVPEEQVTAWREEGNVTLLGHVQDIPALMATADVVVLPSYYREGVPRSLIEAAAAGLPTRDDRRSRVPRGRGGRGQRHSRARARWCGTGGSDSKACPGSGPWPAWGRPVARKRSPSSTSESCWRTRLPCIGSWCRNGGVFTNQKVFTRRDRPPRPSTVVDVFTPTGLSPKLVLGGMIIRPSLYAWI